MHEVLGLTYNTTKKKKKKSNLLSWNFKLWNPVSDDFFGEEMGVVLGFTLARKAPGLLEPCLQFFFLWLFLREGLVFCPGPPGPWSSYFLACWDWDDRHAPDPVFSHWDGGLANSFPGWPQIVILLISASQVARIIGMSHWSLAQTVIILMIIVYILEETYFLMFLPSE
jgi:hypothetical protein